MEEYIDNSHKIKSSDWSSKEKVNDIGIIFGFVITGCKEHIIIITVLILHMEKLSPTKVKKFVEYTTTSTPNLLLYDAIVFREK